MATSPTSKALKWWRDRGCMAQVVEKWNAHAKIRVDLFKVFDLVVLIPVYKSVALVQVTSGSNHAKRRKKLIDSEVFSFVRDNEIDVIMVVHSTRKAANRRIVHRIEGWDQHTLESTPMEMHDWETLA